MTVKRTLKSKTGKVTKAVVFEKCKELVSAKAAIKAITTRHNEIRDELKDLSFTQGRKDAEGSFYLDFPEPVDGVVGLKNQIKVSQSFNADAAEAWLKKRKRLEECQTTVVHLDEAKVLALAAEEPDLLTEKILDSFYVEDESFSLCLVKE